MSYCWSHTPVLGEQVVMDDNTFSNSSGVCPCDLYSMLSVDKISDIFSKLNWSCYQDECYYERHYNTFDNPTCTRCGESF